MSTASNSHGTPRSETANSSVNRANIIGDTTLSDLRWYFEVVVIEHHGTGCIAGLEAQGAEATPSMPAKAPRRSKVERKVTFIHGVGKTRFLHEKK